jgi:hypothetical protein
VAWSEADRASLRHYLGFAPLFKQADPRLESALTSVQAEADGGTQKDNSSELLIRGWLADLATVEGRLREVWTEAEAHKVEDLSVDPYRGMALLRSEGRRLVGNIARILSTRPRHDVFSAAEPNPHGSPYPEIDDGQYPW